tara:strand:- start:261 stop:377 length:117 start_codon:yes stop_codon:yes gene_type:complete
MKKVGKILIMAGLGVGTIWGVLMLIRLINEWAATISCF